MLRLAIAQLRPHKGAYEENLCRLGALFREAGGWAEPPDLMVAPVWKVGQRAREVYFPTGTWRNYWNRSQQFQAV